MENKPYLVIARKYRPQSFEDVIGQNHVAATLRNAIELNRVGHAYLFTGPRGVGKTSMARIFAKSLNCKNGPTIKPCGKCTACVEIEGARSLDVIEIDGASNRGIDEIRALRENVKFAPSAGKFKIYIIDEVHQITMDGFNALLKTLEEPPAHVKFIFATTSAHKVPATILSRCQRFDFKRISTQTIADSLKAIAKQEKIKIEDEALFILAKTADGSLRDSQSLLDQIAASSDDTITKAVVLKSLGVLEEDALVALTQAVIDHDTKKALYLLNEALEEGKEPVLFLEKFLEHTRNLLFVKTSEELAPLLDITETYKRELSEQAGKCARETLFYYFQVISSTLQLMKRFEMKRIPLEIALVKLCQDTPVESLRQLLEQMKNLEKKTINFEMPSSPAPARPVMAERAPVEAEEDEADDELLGEEELIVKSSPAFETVWEPLLRFLKNEKISVATYLAEGAPAYLEKGVAKISFPEHQAFHREYLESTENKKLIEKHLSSLLNEPVRIEFLMVKELNSRPAPQQAAASEEASEAVKSAMNIFGGKVVR